MNEYIQFSTSHKLEINFVNETILILYKRLVCELEQGFEYLRARI